MIPAFDTATGNLPPGLHRASWAEIRDRFGYTDHRRKLLVGLYRVLHALKSVGCRRAYIDGSFITSKQHPGDFDGCWDVEHVDVDELERQAPALLEFANRRKAQKTAYGGEMFPARGRAEPSGTVFVEFFQRDRNTGDPKGIVVIDLKDSNDYE